MAFLHGLIGGGGAVADALGGGIFADAIGIIVGIGMGVVVALVAYAFWWAGIVLLGAWIGYAIGSGLLTAIGIDPGLLTLVAGMAGAAVVGVFFVVYRLPRMAVAAITAVAGAATAVAGVLIFFNIVPMDSLRGGILEAIRQQGWLAALATIGLAVAGGIIQVQFAKNTEVRIYRRVTGEDS